MEHPQREVEYICRKRKYLVHSELNVWFFQENGPLLRQPRKIFAMSCQLCLLCGACEHKRVIVIHNTQRSIIIYWQFCTEGGRSGAHGGCLGGGGQGLLCANDPGSNSHLVFIPLHFKRSASHKYKIVKKNLPVWPKKIRHQKYHFTVTNNAFPVPKSQI